jgi:dTDP-4-dehydrorhamnose reductase
MRILVLGGDGMLGHQIYRQLSPRHEIRVTLRQELSAYVGHGLFHAGNAWAGVNMRDTERLLGVFADFKPEAVINAVGIVKQRADAQASIPSILINSLLPHQLAGMCRLAGARLVHMSTDCVFNGSRGNYSEADAPDAEDLYGRSKLLGELEDKHCITLRTSIIGRELARKTGLIEWFLAQRGSVRGFTHAIYSGFTTMEMSRIIEAVLLKHTALHGVHHVSSDPINKYELLLLVKKHLGIDTKIVPHPDFRCDRSLNSESFRRLVNYQPPSWEKMIDEMAKDPQRGIYDF